MTTHYSLTDRGRRLLEICHKVYRDRLPITAEEVAILSDEITWAVAWCKKEGKTGKALENLFGKEIVELSGV